MKTILSFGEPGFLRGSPHSPAPLTTIVTKETSRMTPRFPKTWCAPGGVKMDTIVYNALISTLEKGGKREIWGMRINKKKK